MRERDILREGEREVYKERERCRGAKEREGESEIVRAQERARESEGDREGH